MELEAALEPVQLASVQLAVEDSAHVPTVHLVAEEPAQLPAEKPAMQGIPGTDTSQQRGDSLYGDLPPVGSGKSSLGGSLAVPDKPVTAGQPELTAEAERRGEGTPAVNGLAALSLVPYDDDHVDYDEAALAPLPPADEYEEPLPPPPPQEEDFEPPPPPPPESEEGMEGGEELATDMLAELAAEVAVATLSAAPSDQVGVGLELRGQGSRPINQDPEHERDELADAPLVADMVGPLPEGAAGVAPAEVVAVVVDHVVEDAGEEEEPEQMYIELLPRVLERAVRVARVAAQGEQPAGEEAPTTPPAIAPPLASDQVELTDLAEMAELIAAEEDTSMQEAPSSTALGQLATQPVPIDEEMRDVPPPPSLASLESAPVESSVPAGNNTQVNAAGSLERKFGEPVAAAIRWSQPVEASAAKANKDDSGKSSREALPADMISISGDAAVVIPQGETTANEIGPTLPTATPATQAKLLEPAAQPAGAGGPDLIVPAETAPVSSKDTAPSVAPERVHESHAPSVSAIAPSTEALQPISFETVPPMSSDLTVAPVHPGQAPLTAEQQADFEQINSAATYAGEGYDPNIYAGGYYSNQGYGYGYDQNAAYDYSGYGYGQAGGYTPYAQGAYQVGPDGTYSEVQVVAYQAPAYEGQMNGWRDADYAMAEGDGDVPPGTENGDLAPPGLEDVPPGLEEEARPPPPAAGGPYVENGYLAEDRQRSPRKSLTKSRSRSRSPHLPPPPPLLQNGGLVEAQWPDAQAGQYATDVSYAAAYYAGDPSYSQYAADGSTYTYDSYTAAATAEAAAAAVAAAAVHVPTWEQVR